MINYTYTATGIKLSQALQTGKGGTSTRRDYAGAFVFVNNAPGWVSTPHGRFVLDGTWKNEFHLRDHLGNTRIALLETGSDSLAILQQNHYYPFGMLNPSLSTSNTIGALKDNRYLYNGKEFNDDFDLDWYDYGARFYDPQIGRFHTQDRFAEKYLSWTPYQYGGNNPIYYVDVNGDSIHVAQQYRDQYLNDLKNVFGDNTSGFSFTESGNLVFTGDTGTFTNEQKAVFNGAFGELMSSGETTSVMYGDTYKANDGTVIDVLNDFGGGLFHAEDNVIVVSSNVTTVSIIPDDLQSILTNTQVSVRQNTTSTLFHEKAEATLAPRVPFRGAVIDYENKVRKIIGLPPRPTDLNHSHTIRTEYQ